MLIVEGVDGVGKTTLAQECCRELHKHGYPYLYNHFSKLPDSFDRVWDYEPWIRRKVVQDRFHLSREVYGRVFHNQPLFTTLEMELIEGMLSNVGAYVVVCYACDNTWLEEQIKANAPDQMYDVSGILEANDYYSKIAQAQHHHFDQSIVVDVDGWPSTFAEAVVRRYLNKQEELDGILRRRPLRS